MCENAFYCLLSLTDNNFHTLFTVDKYIYVYVCGSDRNIKLPRESTNC